MKYDTSKEYNLMSDDAILLLRKEFKQSEMNFHDYTLQLYVAH